MLLLESTAQPTRFPEAFADLDVKKEKTLQTSSNSYPLISIASERWIDSIEITSFPSSCCSSTPSNPCRHPPRIRTRCPVCTNGCRANRSLPLQQQLQVFNLLYRYRRYDPAKAHEADQSGSLQHRLPRNGRLINVHERISWKQRNRHHFLPVAPCVIFGQQGQVDFAAFVVELGDHFASRSGTGSAPQTTVPPLQQPAAAAHLSNRQRLRPGLHSYRSLSPTAYSWFFLHCVFQLWPRRSTCGRQPLLVRTAFLLPRLYNRR